MSTDSNETLTYFPEKIPLSIIKLPSPTGISCSTPKSLQNIKSLLCCTVKRFGPETVLYENCNEIVLNAYMSELAKLSVPKLKS